MVAVGAEDGSLATSSLFGGTCLLPRTRFWHAQSLPGKARSRRTSRCQATGASMLVTAWEAASFSRAAAILSPACAMGKELTNPAVATLRRFFSISYLTSDRKTYTRMFCQRSAGANRAR
jgi:hypothetical protein